MSPQDLPSKVVLSCYTAVLHLVFVCAGVVLIWAVCPVTCSSPGSCWLWALFVMLCPVDM